MAFIIFGEGSGEGNDGKVAVGCVVRNRVYDSLFPNTYTDVLLQNKQFSCLNDDQTNKVILRTIKILYNRTVRNSFNTCLMIANGIYLNEIKDNTDGALWYANINITNYWTETKEVLTQIDNHKFMGHGRN